MSKHNEAVEKPIAETLGFKLLPILHVPTSWIRSRVS